ncbi:septal ring lytic transglycosylase RlpA family protein [Methylocella sp.]|uniref:septal ring lytic transglycosylase RlpA family protein n=1 Tax=Methylocella sp. TaxID=1978226 RepID=UPI003783937B
MKKLAIVATALLTMSVTAEAQSWKGKASYYKARGHMTCAHRTLPFGTHVRVTNLANKKSVVLTVNDRGPFIPGRIVDVSTSAADALGFRRQGVAQVALQVGG